MVSTWSSLISVNRVMGNCFLLAVFIEADQPFAFDATSHHRWLRGESSNSLLAANDSYQSVTVSIRLKISLVKY